eukprot:2134105-Rhodomonas_salina.1
MLSAFPHSMEFRCRRSLIPGILLRRSLIMMMIPWNAGFGGQVSGSSTYSWWAGYLVSSPTTTLLLLVPAYASATECPVLLVVLTRYHVTWPRDRDQASDQAVVIAPRLPVNPSGPFGPCESELQLENPGTSSPSGRLRSNSCKTRDRWSVADRPGLPHARCKEYHSEDFFPPDWILLDEDRSRDVYPAWWGPHVTLLPPRGSGGRVEPGPVVLRVRISHLSAREVTCVYMDNVLLASLDGEGSGLAEVEATVGIEEAAAVREVGACVTEGACG